MRAYILTKVRVDRRWTIAQELHDLNGVEGADLVFGRQDVVIIAEVQDVEGLARLVGTLGDMDGILDTETLIAAS